jgi:hypothetical protein
VDNDEIVDKTTAANDLLAAALETLRGYGIAAATERREVRLGRTTADAIVRLGYGGQEVQYAVELKLGLRPKALGAVIHQLERHGEQGLLVADYVTPPMAEELRARKIPFVDAAGNAFLDQPPLFVWVKGEKPRLVAGAGRPAGRAFQASGLFSPFRNTAHTLQHSMFGPLDLIPFGAVERTDGTIAWPPAGDEVMAVIGYAEAAAGAMTLALPKHQKARVVSLPMLAVLKVPAWKDRHRFIQGKDAEDLQLILRRYPEAGSLAVLPDESEVLDHRAKVWRPYAYDARRYKDGVPRMRARSFLLFPCSWRHSERRGKVKGKPPHAHTNFAFRRPETLAALLDFDLTLFPVRTRRCSSRRPCASSPTRWPRASVRRRRRVH